jgi:hypothetical protein
MKKMTLLFLMGILLFSCSENSSNEEINFIGNVLLQTQEEINAFGENQYQKIVGELAIRPEFGIDNIVDLSPLESINIVEGLIVISGCTELQNVEMNVVESGTLFISNTSCKNINFPHFKRTTSDFISIGNNEILENINLVKLESTGSELRIFNNGRIKNLNGFQSLKSLGSNFGSGIYISSNPMLLDVNGLINVNSNIGVLRIVNNDMISSLDGLENIRFGIVDIVLNDNLSDFCAIKDAVINGNIDGDSFDANGIYTIAENAFNPSVADMTNNNCSQ